MPDVRIGFLCLDRRPGLRLAPTAAPPSRSSTSRPWAASIPGRHEARKAQAALAGVTVGGSPVEVTGLDALRRRRRRTAAAPECVLVETLRRRARRAARPGLRLPLVHGDRAAADGARRHPDDLPARLAARERHRRLRDRAVPRRADRARHRDRLRPPRRRPLARGARRTEAVRTTSPCASAMRHAGSSVVFSGTTVAISLLALLVAAGALPAQHRHRRPADRARQRRRRHHPPAGRPRHRRPAARPARAAAPRARRPRLVGLGARSSSVTAWSRPSPRPPSSRRSSSPPRRSSSATRRPTRSPSTGRLASGLEQLQAAGIGTGPLSPFDALVHVGRRRGASRRVLATVDGVRSASRAGRLAARRHGARHGHPDEDGNSPAGRATLDRLRRTPLAADVSFGGEAAQSADFLARGLRRLPAA